MTFAYVNQAVLSPYDGFPDEVPRPVVTLRVGGPNGQERAYGLVDTGADHTILPKSLADKVGIALVPSPGAPPVTAAGQPMPLMVGRGTLEIGDGPDAVSWEDDLLFHDYGPTTGEQQVLLGAVGFLEFFVATFDVANGELTLVHNGLRP